MRLRSVLRRGFFPASLVVVVASAVSGSSSAAPTPPPPPGAKVVTHGPACVTLPMLAHYTFDGTLADGAGGNAAFAPGAVAPTFGAGRFGQGLHFTNGAFARTTIKALPEKWTTSQWVYQAAMAVPDTAAGPSGCAGVKGTNPIVAANGVNWVAAYTYGNTGSSCPPPLTVLMAENVTARSAISGWTHLVTVFDGAVGHVYQDGWLVKDTGHFPYDVKSAKEWRLGAALEAGIQHTFVGAIDDLRVYGVALTADQIKNLFDHDDVNAVNACPRAMSASER